MGNSCESRRREDCRRDTSKKAQGEQKLPIFLAYREQQQHEHMSQASHSSEDATAMTIKQGSEKALAPILHKKPFVDAILPDLDAKGEPKVDEDRWNPTDVASSI